MILVFSNIEKILIGLFVDSIGHTFCNFIDAGDGKECSDDKLRGVCLIFGYTRDVIVMIISPY